MVSHPEIANETSLLQNIAEYVPTWISQSYSGQQEENKERVLWAKFQQLDSNAQVFLQEGAEPKGLPPPLILVLGYSSGYSVWTVKGDTGEAQEVAAQHTGGQVQLVTLLQTPDKDVKDSYSSQRPLLAVVPKPYDTLVPFSLQEGKELGKKYHISFKTGKTKAGEIVNIVSNARYAVVVLQSRIIVLDAGNLNSFLFCVKNHYPTSEYPCNPVALGTQWLAYSTNSMDTHNQSQGGVYNDDGVSVKAKVLDTMEGLYRVVSNYLKGGHGGELQTAAHNTHTPGQNNSVVTVLDIQRVYHKVPHEESGVVTVDLKKMDRDSGVMAHFLAYQEQDRRLVAMAFDPSGMLLLTACSEGRIFNLFKILPHPWHSSETCVQHLYKLRRGDTTGIVQSIAFSTDSRWAAVSTLRGTTHVFPVTPFGGPITKRTHLSSRMVNKSGKFHITAGLTDPKLSSSSLTQLPEQSYSPDLTFSLHHLGNPHVLSLLEKPLEVFPLVQIKQPSVPMATSESEHSPKAKQRAYVPPPDCLPGHVGIVTSAVFADSRGKWKDSSHSSKRQEPVKTSAVSSLYIVGGNSILTEHILTPRVAKEAKGKDDRNWKAGPDDAPIEMDTSPRLMWNLTRPPTANSLYFASKDCNPLLVDPTGERCAEMAPAPEEWLANVEVLTHEEPPRRLWMGPQFVMKTYSSVDGSGDEELSKDSFSGPFTDEQEDDVMAILPTEKEGDLLLQTLHDAKHGSSKPMLIPQGKEQVEENFIDTGPSSLGPEFVECFGSWKDQMPLKNGFHPHNVSKELEEAMKDSPKVQRKERIPFHLPSTPEEEFHDPLSQ